MFVGGTLDLECVTKPPAKIWWWLNGTKLDFFTHRGGVFIETYNQKRSSSSKLRIADFSMDDGGIYECRADFGSKSNLNKRPPSIETVDPTKDSVLVSVIEPTKAPLFSVSEETASTGSKLMGFNQFNIVSMMLISAIIQ